jgi:hypothetical protein
MEQPDWDVRVRFLRSGQQFVAVILNLMHEEGDRAGGWGTNPDRTTWYSCCLPGDLCERIIRYVSGGRFYTLSLRGESSIPPDQDELPVLLLQSLSH